MSPLIFYQSDAVRSIGEKEGREGLAGGMREFLLNGIGVGELEEIGRRHSAPVEGNPPRRSVGTADDGEVIGRGLKLGKSMDRGWWRGDGELLQDA
jgi:hypothetical protein